MPQFYQSKHYDHDEEERLDNTYQITDCPYDETMKDCGHKRSWCIDCRKYLEWLKDGQKLATSDYQVYN